MKLIWFVRKGWFFVPVSIPGTIAIILAVAFCLNVFLAVDRHSHSVSDCLYNIFPYFACVFLLFNWLAANTSNPPASDSDSGVNAPSGKR
jgi:hypothetical protein